MYYLTCRNQSQAMVYLARNTGLKILQGNWALITNI